MKLILVAVATLALSGCYGDYYGRRHGWRHHHHHWGHSGMVVQHPQV